MFYFFSIDFQSCPISGESMPKIRLANSVRPEPNKPAIPTTSLSEFGNRLVQSMSFFPNSFVSRTVFRLSDFSTFDFALEISSSSSRLRPKHIGNQLNSWKGSSFKRANQLSIAQYGNSVSNFIHLIKEMGNKNNPNSFSFNFRITSKSCLVSCDIQTGGRFIQNQYFG